MRNIKTLVCAAFVACLGSFGMIQNISAQFAYTNNDLVLGFRKTGANQESFEAVANIGKAINYRNLAAGVTTNITSFTSSQLKPDTFSTLSNLNWSVFGYSKTNNIFQLPSGFVNNVLWLTVPRANTNTQSTAPTRLTYSAQGAAGTKINSIGGGAAFLSSLSAAGPDNTSSYFKEALDGTYGLSVFMGAVGDSTASTLNDKWTQNNLENTTPANFNAAVVSDLYEVFPLTDAQNHPIADPHTGQTSGDAYYVGFFRFNPNGTMTFTRASASAPPAPTLTISRTGNVSTVSFGTTNAAIYTLYFTNETGLASPVSTWPSSPTTITGDGAVKSFVDTTTDSTRFYRVKAQ